MAAPTNTFITNSAVGNRESLHNIITILNKDETPFVSTIGSGNADATYEDGILTVELPVVEKAPPQGRYRITVERID